MIFNLLSQPEKKKLRSEYLVRLFIVFLSSLLATALIALVSLTPSYVNTLLKRNEINRKVESLKTSDLLANNEKLNVLLLKTKAKIDVLKPKRSVYLYEIVDELLKNKTADITFDTISFTDTSASQNGESTIGVRGKAKTRDALYAFQKKYEKGPLFVSTQIPRDTFLEKENISFSASIHVKY